MPWSVLFLVITSYVANADPDHEALHKRDMAALQGEWSMVGGEMDGSALSEKVLKASKRVVKGDETFVTFNETTLLHAKFTIDPTKNPKTIDYVVSEGRNKGKTQLGIYAFDGEKLRFCVAAPGLERPTAFEAKEGSGWSYVVWKHDKK